MTQKNRKTGKTLRIIGCGLCGPGYPNAWNTVQLLEQQKTIRIVDSAAWLPEDFHLWKMVRGSTRDRLRGIWLIASGTLRSCLRLAANHRRGDWLYLPYPSLPMLWLLSWLPAWLRPTCIADAYITLWDTLFQDRQLGKPQGQLSRYLLAAESRALRAANTIIVDTQANADHLSGLFGVPRQRIRAFPLAIDPQTLPALDHPAAPKGGKVRVLFIGTFVPLQGTTVIAQAIALLADRDDMEFMLIGDGQQADEAAKYLKGLSNVTWLRGWQSPQKLATEIANADICLGVFGGEGKSSRVLPFKLYMALATSKAIITQSSHSTPDGVPPIPAIICTPEPKILAQSIEKLSADKTLRRIFQHKARIYYDQYLTSNELAKYWLALLDLTTKT